MLLLVLVSLVTTNAMIVLVAWLHVIFNHVPFWFKTLRKKAVKKLCAKQSGVDFCKMMRGL